jgi:hypothetical protein
MAQRRRTPPVHRLDDLARHVAPHLEVISVSNPDPVFRQRNLVAVTSGEDAAREAVVALEADSEEDADIGVVIMSADPDRAAVGDATVDPEHVTGYTARRIGIGGVIGAVVGALLIGVPVAIIVGSVGAAIGASVGGALFGFYIGGTWLPFTGLGGSDAYRQTFVAPELVDVALVAFHTDSAECLERARSRLDDVEHLALIEVDENGRTIG